MTYRIVLTERATHDLDEAYQWYAERIPGAASRWYNGLLNAIRNLSHDPLRCPVAAESKKLPMEIRQLVYGPQRSYRALFVVQKQTVIVLHIRHTARQDARIDEIF